MAISDVLLQKNVEAEPGGASLLTRQNYAASLDDLRDVLRDVGFTYIRVEDSSEQGHKAYYRYLFNRLEKDVTIEPSVAGKTLQLFQQQFNVHIASCMIYAIK